MADNTDAFAFDWEEAISSYEETTNSTVSADRTFTRYKSYGDLDRALQQQQGDFGNLRSNHRKLYDKLAKCMLPLEAVLGIVQSGIGSTPYAPAAVLFGAAASLLQACTRVSEAYDALELLFEKLGDVTVRLKEYEHLRVESSLKAKLTKIVGFMITVMGKAEKLAKRGRVKQWAHSVFTTNPDIKDSIDELDRYVNSELGLVMTLIYGHTSQVRDNQAKGNLIMNKILENQQVDRKRVFSEAEEKRLERLLTPNCAHELNVKYDKNLEVMTPRTGEWLRKDPLFEAWEHEQAPILWVLGKPGVGKSILATQTVEILRSNYIQHSDIPSLTSVNYLAFGFDNNALQDCASLWKTAAAQIAKHNDRFKKHVLGLHDTSGITTARQIWKSVFLDFYSSNADHSNLAYIVVDGLDEAPKKEQVIFITCLEQLIRRIADAGQCRIQIVILARPDVRSIEGFERVGFERRNRIIEVTPDRNTGDIDSFVKQQLLQVPVLKKYKKRKPDNYKRLAKEIYKTVMDRAGGMFLWAWLVFDAIGKEESSKTVLEALQRAPRGLDEMLHHIFKRLEADEQQHSSYLYDLLMWVFFAQRRLTIAELFVLLYYTTGQDCVFLERELRGRYSSLFELTCSLGVDSNVEDLIGNASSQTGNTEQDSEVEDMSYLNDATEAADDSSEGTSSEYKSDEDSDSSLNRPHQALGVPVAASTDIQVERKWNYYVVTFQHAGIRDYVEGQISKEVHPDGDCSLFLQNPTDFKIRGLLACIQVLTSNISEESGAGSLYSYATRFWIEHLAGLTQEDVESPGAVHAARAVAHMFHKAKLMSWLRDSDDTDFVNSWFESGKYSSMVTNLITAHIQGLEDCDRSWAESLKMKPEALFGALLEACARKWLTKDGWDDAAYLDKSDTQVHTLYAYYVMTHPECGCRTRDYHSIGIPLPIMRAMSELVPMERTEHWYTGLGWILMVAHWLEDHTRLAIEYFEKALSISPGGWVAKEGLANAYANGLGDYATGIRIMREAIDELPKKEGFGHIEFYLQASMASWYNALSDRAEAVAATKMAYESSRVCDWLGDDPTRDRSVQFAIKAHLQALYNVGQYSDCISLIEDADARLTNTKSGSFWTRFLRAQNYDEFDCQVFEKATVIADACSFGRVKPLMLGGTWQAVGLDLQEVPDEDGLTLGCEAIEWLSRYTDAIPDVQRMCERLIQLIDNGSEVDQQASSWSRDEIAAALAMIYLDQAMEAQVAHKDPKEYVSLLAGLAYHRQGGKKYARASYPATALGYWYHEIEHTPDQLWRSCLRPTIAKALYLLSDEDPWNDQSAYAQLGEALLRAGDVDNARIALGIALRPLAEAAGPPGSVQGSTTERHDAADSERDAAGLEREANGTPEAIEDTAASINDKYSGFEIRYGCDGRCQTPRKDYKELHWCRICDDTCFCEACIVLLKNAGLPFRKCKPEHDLVQVFPVSGKATTITDALVERRFEPQQEWLKSLETIWEV